MGILPQPMVSTDAVVLRAWPCGETSVIASLLTRDLGYIRVMAKAARRPRSLLRPLVEPGRLLNVDFSLDQSRELQYLRSGSVSLDPLSGGFSLEQSAFLLSALELVDRCRPQYVPHEESSPADLFEVCDAFIRMLSSFPEIGPARIFFAFEWKLLGHHGLDPEIRSCSSCGSVPDAVDDEKAIWFSASEGGIVCHACGGGSNVGQPLSPLALQEFMAYESGSFLEDDHIEMNRALRREVGTHLHRFLGFHLPGYRLPIALDLLRPIPRPEENS